MPVGFHRECAAVLVTEPAGDCRDVHARFNAAGCEQMPQIVVGETNSPQLFASRIYRALTFVNTHDKGGREFRSLIFHSFQQTAHVGNHWNAADFPILSSGRRIAQDRDFTFLEVTVSTVDTGGFAFAAAAVSKKLYQVGTTVAVTSVSVPNGFDELQELVVARQLQKFLANLFSLNVNRRIVIPRPRFNRNIQNQTERADSIVER